MVFVSILGSTVVSDDQYEMDKTWMTWIQYSLHPSGSAAQSAGSRRGERGAGDWDGGFVSTRDFAALF
jgi:hypothetical protein